MNLVGGEEYPLTTDQWTDFYAEEDYRSICRVDLPIILNEIKKHFQIVVDGDFYWENFEKWDKWYDLNRKSGIRYGHREFSYDHFLKEKEREEAFKPTEHIHDLTPDSLTIEEVKTFLSDFFKAEALTIAAFPESDLVDYNNKLAVMHRYCVKELENKFGMRPRTELWDNHVYTEGIEREIVPREIFKISQYYDPIYGNVCVAYVTLRNPNWMFNFYDESIFVSKIDGKLQIIKTYMRLTDKFENGIGLENISFETLTTPIGIERYNEPEDDDYEMSVKHYLMNI